MDGRRRVFTPQNVALMQQRLMKALSSGNCNDARFHCGECPDHVVASGNSAATPPRLRAPISAALGTLTPEFESADRRPSRIARARLCLQDHVADPGRAVGARRRHVRGADLNAWRRLLYV